MLLLSYILLVIGGFIGYIGPVIFKKTTNDKENYKVVIIIKSIGFILVLIGLIFLLKTR